MNSLIWNIALVLFLAIQALVRLKAQETENHVLVLVPAPVKSGSTESWATGISQARSRPATTWRARDTHSVRAAAMHDARNLYLSFRFRDPTPMENWTDLALHPQGGWRGDPVQVRIQTDRIVHRAH